MLGVNSAANTVSTSRSSIATVWKEPRVSAMSANCRDRARHSRKSG